MNALIPPKYAHYVAFDPENDGIDFIFGESYQEVVDEVDGKLDRKESVDGNSEAQYGPENELDGKFQNILDKLNKSMHAHKLLIYTMSELARSIIEDGVRSRSRNFIKSNMCIVGHHGSVKIYGCDDSVAFNFLDIIKSNTRLVEGVSYYPSAILLSIVSLYDAIFSDILKMYLLENKERYKNSDKTYSVEKILSFKSLDNLFESLASNEVESLMRGGHKEQIEFVKKSTKIDLKSSCKNWNLFMEIFERRNILTHNSGIANDIYINNCKEFGHVLNGVSVGDRVHVSADYLLKSITILHEMLLIMIFDLWEKKSKSYKQSLYFSFNQCCFDMMVDGNPEVPVRVLNYILNKEDTSSSEQARRMMSVNLSIAFKMKKEFGLSDMELARFQWDSSSDLFKLCIAAVQQNFDVLLPLMKKMRGAGDLSERSFKTWPAFQWVRSDEKFRAAVKEFCSA